MAKKAKTITSPRMRSFVKKGTFKTSLTKVAKKDIKKPPGLGKIRVGIIWGKDYDPIKVGTQDKDYPAKFKMKNNTGSTAGGWGGQFHCDVSTGLKMKRLHPDIFEIDFIRKDQVTKQRLAKNHVTFDMMGSLSVVLMAGEKALAASIQKVQSNPASRHFPAWEHYEWNLDKARYMKQCAKVGIPMIDTIFIDGHFDAKAVLKKVQSKGWDKFLVKPSYQSFFGAGIINGKTQDFADNVGPLLEYEKENKCKIGFLVQPCVLKPNGHVFDEIRHFFIDGEWSYAVYTDGVDYAGFWEQPEGPLKEATDKLAVRAYQEVHKSHKWEGTRLHTLMNRVDIGIVPDKSKKLGYRIFLNEVAPHMSTWLGRYCPFILQDKMGEATVKKTRELLKLSLAAGRNMPNATNVEKLLELLDARLGPLDG